MAVMNPRAIFLPYCIKRLEDGRHVVLNRNYKPLGFLSANYLRYEDYPIAVKFKGLTPKKAAAMSARGDANLDTIYLYNDGCIPNASAADMKNYLARLAILAKLSFADDDY